MIREYDPPLKIGFVKKWQEYDSVCSFLFTKPEGLEFEAGQNARVIVPSIEDTDERKRSLSFANAPHEEHLMFSIHTGSGSPYKKALMDLREGDELDLVKVKGRTFLPEDTTTPIVLIAGGVGITPFRSILLDAEHRGLDTKLSLVHVSSGPYLYEEELAPLPYQQQRIRRADVEIVIVATAAAQPNAHYFVAGSPSFLESINKLLIENGISEESITISRFTGYTEMYV